MTLDVSKIREDFPNLAVRVHGKPLVYLDNAATTFKPKSVIEVVNRHYLHEVSNIHRGVHHLSEQATLAYEDTRTKVRNFIGAKKDQEIIFTRGTTESLNLVAQSYGRTFLKAGDEILITEMEHHSNIVPWQMLCEQTGAVLKVAPFNDRGELILEEFEKRLSEKTKIVSMVHISNSLGTINPIQTMIDLAHKHGAIAIVDAAQSVAHHPIDVQKLDCDFLAFSSHKIFGPTGCGVLYGKEALLNKMPPLQGGGDMIASVTFEKTTYNVLPYKFEAGTPHIAGVIGLGAALDYVKGIGLQNIAEYEHSLQEYAAHAVKTVPGLIPVGEAEKKAAIVAFTMGDIHPHDIGSLVDLEGVAIRTGHHCCQPVMKHYKVPATARASFALYNTREDVDALVRALYKVREVFK